MKNLKVTWKGISPLIMHSCQCVNPLHSNLEGIKKVHKQKSKTDEDLEKLPIWSGKQAPIGKMA